ncbi:cTAGE family member 2-like [Castor canadensis]
MWTLTSRLVKMTDWAAVLGEDLVVEDDLELGLQATESAAPGERQPAGPLATLATAARLRARLQSLEEERSQIRTRLLEEDKITDDLRERIRTLEAERAAMDLEKRHFQSVKEKLQQKADVMKEVHLQNRRKLIWQITLEERQRLDKEKELGQTLGKISHADEELKTCKKQLRHLEKQLEAASLQH